MDPGAMMEDLETVGECLCGAVRVRVGGAYAGVGVCHCNMCRRWSSGPMMVVTVGEALVIEGHEAVTVYRSSRWAERAFCTKCGSHLYYHLGKTGQYLVSAGLFDHQDGLEMTHQIFIDKKPGFYEFSNDTKKRTGIRAISQYIMQRIFCFFG